MENSGETLHGFTIAGSDGIYVNARARIIGKDKVRVYNERVEDPQNVTYAFDNLNQRSNLANSEGIPASPFRTDKIGDTAMKPQLTYFVGDNWIYADQDEWVNDVENEQERGAGVRPSWKTEDGTYSYDTENKAEGMAAVRLQWEKPGEVHIEPVLSYESLKTDYSRYKNITVKISNPEKKADSIGISVISGDRTYHLIPEDGQNTEKWNVQLNTDGAYQTVAFRMTVLESDGQIVEETADIWKHMTRLLFTFETRDTGSVYLDDVSFGMTGAVVTEPDDKTW